MNSKIKKISKRKTLKKDRKQKKTRVKNQHKMRGGAAAAPSMTAISCLDIGDPHLVQIGNPDINYLSNAPYIGNTMYSDHAPIIYNFGTAPPPLKNDYLNIITWNIGQWGNQRFESTPGSYTYNHKFNLSRTETEDEYKIRIRNIVAAMRQLLQNNKPRGNNDPFLFCQELPVIFGKGKLEAKSKELRNMFKDLLSSEGLKLISDSDDSDDILQPNVQSVSEFGLIGLTVNSSSQKFTVLKKLDYWDSAYDNGKLIFPHGPGDKEWHRFEIYYYMFTNRTGITTTFYYVNVHVSYTNEPAIILNFFNRIIDTIQVYRASQGMNIDNVSVYIIGDYNFNIASPIVVDFVKNATYKDKTGKNVSKYDGNPLNIFGNKFLKPNGIGNGRKITNMYKLTTQNAHGYSLMDNFGNSSPCNVDCVLKLDLAQV